MLPIFRKQHRPEQALTFRRRARKSLLSLRSPCGCHSRHVALNFEALEPRTMLDATLTISEFLASNSGGLKDEDGDSSDWIEVFNPTSSAVNLQGWHLTDDSTQLSKWTFPSVTIQSGGYELVWASGKDRTVATAPLHTNFQLDKDGEYLALVEPNGVTVASAYTPQFPEQRANISYGIVQNVANFLDQGSQLTFHVPTSDEGLGTSWTTVGFNDTSWIGTSSVVVTEANTSTDDWVEIENVTSAAVNTSGWVVAANDATSAKINSVAATNWSLPSSMTASQILYRTDNSGDTTHYWGQDLTLNSRGWVMIVTNTGQVADFVVWGYTASDVASLNVTVNGFNIQGGNWTSWSGAPVNSNGADLVSLQRTGSIDTNSAADWKVATPTQGTANSGMTVPFKTSATAGIGYISTSSDFTSTVYMANVSVTSESVAETVISTPSKYTAKYVASAMSINYINTGSASHFDNDQPFPGTTIGTDVNNFVLLSTGKVIIPTAGQWTFGVNSDDGFKLTLTLGSTVFTSSYTGTRASGDTLSTFNIATAGVYDVRLVMFDYTGGSCCELFAAQGSQSSFNSNFHLVGDTTNGGLAMTGFGSALQTNIQAQMLNVNTAVWTRFPFTVTNPSQYIGLKLDTKYNDGFVAYLNGTEIARRNAPASVTWNSQASGIISSPYSWVEEEINLAPYLYLLQPGNNVLAFQGLNASSGTTDFFLLPKLTGIAQDPVPLLRYFSEPTPNEPNLGTSYIDFVADAKLSVDHGFFTSSFQVSITTDTPGASIYYTRDGSEPSPTNGTLYTTPLTVSQTTALRAAAFKTGYYSSAIATETYIFTADVLLQSPTGQAPAGWPTGPINGQVINYGMDPDIVNDPTWGPQLQAALKSIPTISIVTDLDNLFDPTTGIYVNALNDGHDWERAASVELINPDGTVGFQIDAGLRIRGRYSREDFNPKHAFRLFFDSEYGASELVYPLLGTDGTDTFKNIDLRCSQNYAWASRPESEAIKEAQVRDAVCRDLEGLAGEPTTRGNPYQLYIDGQYWGLYETEERAEADYAATYFGGKSEDYDVIKTDGTTFSVYATDGTIDAWQTLWTLAKAGLSTNAAYYRVLGCNPDGTRNPNYAVLVNEQNLIDYMINIFYSGNMDAPISNFLGNAEPNNVIAIYNRNGQTGFMFFVHDNEHTFQPANDLVGGDANRTLNFTAGDTFQYSNPQWLHQQMMANPEYRQKFADRVQKLFFNGGVYTPEQVAAVYTKRANAISLAIIAESARWGDAQRATPYTKTDWQNAVNTDRAWITTRSNIVLNQLKATTLRDGSSAPLFPSVAAPLFSQRGGVVQTNYALTLTASAGTIYYTLDGSNPRLLGGAVNTTALIYSGSPIIITDSTLVRVRARSSSGVWSAIDQAQFLTQVPASINNLIVSEMNYNPVGATAHELSINPSWTGEDFEFIELKNIGADYIDLTGVKFTAGVTFDFTGKSLTKLYPGETVLVVANLTAFPVRYGQAIMLRVAGAYSGKLSNGGEQVTLVDYLNAQILGFTYDDEGDWPGRADGNGSSLELINPDLVPKTASARTAYLQDPANWRSSSEYGGSPGTMGVGPLNGIVVNEVLSHTDYPLYDSIELYNPTDSAVDIGGWYLSDSNKDYQKYRVPDGTLLAPHEYRVFTEEQFGISSFSADTQPGDGDAQSLDLGTTLFLDGSTWRKIPISCMVSANTVLEFDYMSDQQGQIQGIGLEEDNIASSNRLFQLYGTSSWGISDYKNYSSSAPGWKHYVIPVGGYYTGNMAYLVFANGGSANNATGYFKNVKTYESTAGSAMNFDKYFGLNASEGDEVWLLKANSSGNLTYFVDHVEFGAAANGESFGRWPNGSGILYPLKNRTVGEPNDEGGNGPRFGPLMISEVMYNPSVSAGQNPDDYEYIEIFNPTDAAMQLDNWHLADGIDFAFTAGTVINSREALLVLPFDPSLPGNATKLANFKAKYGIGSGVKLLGAYSGKLSDNGDRVQLQRPDTPLGDPHAYPALLEDEVAYGVLSPWPAAADGGGSSLQRLTTAAWGDDAASWIAAAPTPGTAMMIASAGDWGGSGLTLKIDSSDGLVHLYQTGTATNVATPCALASITSVDITGRDGVDDVLTIDFSNGNPVPAGGVVFNGGVLGGGSGNSLVVIGSSASDSVTLSAAQLLIAGAAPITYSNTAFFSFLLGSGDSLLLNSGATLRINQNNAISAGTNLTIQGGTLDLNGKTDTIGSLLLKSGSVINGTLHAGSYVIESGTATANIAGPGNLQKNTDAQATAGTVSASNVTVNGGGLTVASVSTGTLTLAAGTTLTIEAIPGGPTAADILTPVAALISHPTSSEMLSEATLAEAAAESSPAAEEAVGAEPQDVAQAAAIDAAAQSSPVAEEASVETATAASAVLATPGTMSVDEASTAAASSISMSDSIIVSIDVDAVAAPTIALADKTPPVPLTESFAQSKPIAAPLIESFARSKPVDTAVHQFSIQPPTESKINSLTLPVIVGDWSYGVLAGKQAIQTKSAAFTSSSGESPSIADTTGKRPFAPAIDKWLVHSAALQTIVSNPDRSDGNSEAVLDIARHARTGKHTSQLENALDGILAEKEDVFLLIE
jgi:hypothetical protein